jgi:mono/diheme cytochrome c family protein
MAPLNVLRCTDRQQGHGPMLRRDLTAMIAGITALPLAANAQHADPSIARQNGAALYSQYCSQCHDTANTRAPSLSVLQSMTLAHVLRALSTGSMASIAQERTNAEGTAIASFIAGKGSEAPSASTDISGQCPQNPVGFPQRLDGPRWNGWGRILATVGFSQQRWPD